MRNAPAGSRSPAASASNKKVAIAVLSMAVFMGGMAYAAVPLYKLFCQITGFGGTPRISEVAPTGVGERTLNVRFDANMSSDLDWAFEADTTSIELRTGTTATIFYRVTNRTAQPLTGMATYNVTPHQAGSYFNKISCFCFTEQTLAPGETIDMPVVFYLDPALEKDEVMKKVPGITLSYTFVPVRQPKNAPVAARETGSPRL